MVAKCKPSFPEERWRKWTLHLPPINSPKCEKAWSTFPFDKREVLIQQICIDYCLLWLELFCLRPRFHIMRQHAQASLNFLSIFIRGLLSSLCRVFWYCLSLLYFPPVSQYHICHSEQTLFPKQRIVVYDTFYGQKSNTTQISLRREINRLKGWKRDRHTKGRRTALQRAEHIPGNWKKLLKDWQGATAEGESVS